MTNNELAQLIVLLAEFPAEEEDPDILPAYQAAFDLGLRRLGIDKLKEYASHSMIVDALIRKG